MLSDWAKPYYSPCRKRQEVALLDLGLSYTLVSASVNRFAISMVVRTYPIPSTIATLCRSSGSAFALGLAHPQVPSLVHCFPCVRWQAFVALPSPKKQCRQRVKSEKSRWRNIYTHTCGYCYVFQIFGAKLIYFLVCSKLFVLHYINSWEIFLLD